jgi:hypothetical protein
MPAAGVPGRGWYWLAGGIALATTAAVAALVAWLVLALTDDAQFLVPGRHVVELARPGDYVIWNDHRAVFEGRSYNASDQLPSALKITVTEAANGRPLAVRSSLGTSMKTSITDRVSVARFTVEKPGQYEIAVAGRIEPRPFSVGPDLILRWIGVIFGVIALVFAGYSAAIGIAVFVYMRRALGEPAGAKPAG